MKVLFITTFGIGYKGGANISSSLLADLLRENGVEVKTLFIRSEKPETRLDRFLSFLSEDFYQLRNPVLDMLVRAKVRRCVREYQPDIIDVQDRYAISALAGSDLGGVKKVFTIVDELTSERLIETHRFIKRFLINIKRREILGKLKRERFLLATSNYGKDVLAGLGINQDRVEVMYRSLPPKDWYQRRPGEEEVAGRDDDRVRFLMPGRISRERGVELMAGAVSLLSSAGLGGEFDVLLMGKGAMSDWLKRTIAREGLANVSVMEPVPIGEMYRWYLWSDVVVLPTRGSEMFGRSALESMLIGRPIITTMLGGTREIVGDVEGSHIRIGDERDLAEAMGRFITDRGLAGRMKQ